MVEDEAEWAGVAGSARLLPVQFIQHPVEEVADAFQKECPLRYFWHYRLLIVKVRSKHAEYDEERCGGEDEAAERNEIWSDPLRNLLN